MDFKTWIELGIFLIGWIAVVATVKQSLTDLKERVDELKKDVQSGLMKADLDAKSINQRLDADSKAISLHDERINVLKATLEKHDRESTIIHEESKGDLIRHSRQLNKLDKWVAVANTVLKKLDGAWIPPVNGD